MVRHFVNFWPRRRRFASRPPADDDNNGSEWLPRFSVESSFDIAHYRPRERPNSVRIVHPKNGEQAWWPLFDETGEQLFPELMSKRDENRETTICGLVFRRDHKHRKSRTPLPCITGWKDLRYLRGVVKEIIRAAGCAMSCRSRLAGPVGKDQNILRHAASPGGHSGAQRPNRNKMHCIIPVWSGSCVIDSEPTCLRYRHGANHSRLSSRGASLSVEEILCILMREIRRSAFRSAGCSDCYLLVR